MTEPSYEELRAEVERLRSQQPTERDFDVAAYLSLKIEEARGCGPVLVLGQKGQPDQHIPGTWVPLTDLPTLATPQGRCSTATTHGPHYWHLAGQTTGPDGPVTLCPGVRGFMLLTATPRGQ